MKSRKKRGVDDRIKPDFSNGDGELKTNNYTSETLKATRNTKFEIHRRGLTFSPNNDNNSLPHNIPKIMMMLLLINDIVCMKHAHTIIRHIMLFVHVFFQFFIFWKYRFTNQTMKICMFF